MSNPQPVRIKSEPIELFKVLKIHNIVAGGGEAKMVIAEGMVSVNGEVETRKRRKIMQGDIIEFEGHTMQVVLREEED